MDLKLDLHDRLRVSTPAALLSLDASALQVLQGPSLPAVPALHKSGACVACVAAPGFYQPQAHIRQVCRRT